jgi:hypothetical protein
MSLACASTASGIDRRSTSSTRIRNAPGRPARIVELLDRQADSKVEIGVGEDHEWRLAAELEGHGTMLGAAALAITPAVGTEPVNASRGYRMSRERCPAWTPVPWTTLKTPAGSPASWVMSG